MPFYVDCFPAKINRIRIAGHPANSDWTQNRFNRRWMIEKRLIYSQLLPNWKQYVGRVVTFDHPVDLLPLIVLEIRTIQSDGQFTHFAR
jgi:hypothetical protein